jgi:hypothetical protein
MVNPFINGKSISGNLQILEESSGCKTKLGMYTGTRMQKRVMFSFTGTREEQ